MVIVRASHDLVHSVQRKRVDEADEAGATFDGTKFNNIVIIMIFKTVVKIAVSNDTNAT